MKISSNQRVINIINKALENGFEFNETDRMEEIRIKAEEFLIENTEAIEEECEIVSLGNHGQRVDWNDEYGFWFWQQGEIVRFSDNWNKHPETKIFHNTILDSKGRVINLYYLVGETEFNVPTGYYFHPKEKKHFKELEAQDAESSN